MVRAVLAGQPVAAPVVFTLGGGYELEIRTSSAWGSR
jgi:acetoin utilization deacetylase AcuC-like enzyme